MASPFKFFQTFTARIQGLSLFTRIFILMFPLLTASIAVVELIIRWFDLHVFDVHRYWLVVGPLFFSAVIALFLARFTAKEVAHPIKQFIESAKAIARGNFNQKVNVQSSDEMIQLSRIFNYMTLELKRINDININRIIREKIKTETIMRNIADGVIVVGPIGDVLMVNEVVEGWFNVKEKAVIGFSINFFFPDMKFFVARVLSSPVTAVFQDEFRIKPVNHPTEIFLGANASRVVDNDELIAIVIVLRNITREKEIDRMKTELVNVVAHELRSPLTSIAGFSEILKDPKISDAIRKEYISIIHYESGRLAEMISKFLDISRIESGKTVMNKIPTDLIATVTSVLNVHTALAQKKSITVKTFAPENVPPVLADPDLIGQAVLNLYSNAVKYSHDRSEIAIYIRLRENDVMVEFRDQGIGISKDNLQHLFEKFFRAKEDKHVKEVEGTGLGLAFVREIVNQHGGAMHVESELGTGSSFSFTLPIYRAEGETKKAEDDALLNAAS